MIVKETRWVRPRRQRTVGCIVSFVVCVCTDRHSGISMCRSIDGDEIGLMNSRLFHRIWNEEVEMTGQIQLTPRLSLPHVDLFILSDHLLH